jgi:hypothetical protein
LQSAEIRDGMCKERERGAECWVEEKWLKGYGPNTLVKRIRRVGALVDVV